MPLRRKPQWAPFMAGVVPGTLLGLVLMVAIYIIAVKKNLPALAACQLSPMLSAARKAVWGLLLMVIILGGIYSGMFTPTEGSGSGRRVFSFYCLICL